MLPRDWHTHVTALACQGVVLSQHLVTQAVIEACHAHGWWCASYTVNEWDMAQRLFGWGIDHIVTDEVGLFKP
jgi:glycerophosphoryl diester phosphodiesterase